MLVAPGAPVLSLTRDLRSSSAAPRQPGSLAQHILTLPGCRRETVLALPAWTALESRGSHYDRTYPTVLALVAGILGDDRQAWHRLTDSPISHSGPNARLRLGDILKAAAGGTDGPKPPASR
ncbi:hypothetical protein [Kitasatospora aureofaciens]|uniref:hypothetical protein n=1 Tax=Kitasatospora aureofaciens TaxID=1894 RepID=UPI0037C59C86